MKPTIIFLISIFLFSCVEKKNRTNLKGKVHLVTTVRYKAVEKFGEIEKDSIVQKSTSKFNEEGNEIENADYNSDGSLNTKTIFKYDKAENILEECSYNSNGNLSSKIIYTYDNKGKKKESNSYYESDGKLASSNKYDENGNDIEWSFYLSSGKLMNKVTYKFDDKGNKTEDNIVESLAIIAGGKTIYEYDNNNNMTGAKSYEPNGSLSGESHHDYKNYDVNGNWTMQITYYNEKLEEVIERTIEYY